MSRLSSRLQRKIDENNDELYVDFYVDSIGSNSSDDDVEAGKISSCIQIHFDHIIDYLGIALYLICVCVRSLSNT